jgi:hypothetical protein
VANKLVIAAISLLMGMAAQTAPAQATKSAETAYKGMCDASAGVALGGDLFAVANDEDNAIRVYDSSKGGSPVRSFELSRFLRVDPQHPETDLEGACWLGDKIFWMSSQSRNKEGKYRESRHYFFATKWVKVGNNYEMVAIGQPYRNLLLDFIRDPRLRPYRLDLASLQAPKSRGALNIEGMCPTPEKHLLLGFRNPIPQGRALILPLLNPEDLLEGKPANFGEPILLDLDGLGIRDMALRADGRYLILAGSYNSEGETKLYEWKGGKAEPERVKNVKLKDFNAEAIIVYPDGREAFQLLSDDGTKLVDGTRCKELADPLRKQFRSVWVELKKKTDDKQPKR